MQILRNFICCTNVCWEIFLDMSCLLKLDQIKKIYRRIKAWSTLILAKILQVSIAPQLVHNVFN